MGILIRLFTLAAALLAAGCVFDGSFKDGVIACSDSGACPPGLRCASSDGRCYHSLDADGGAPCLPLSCAEQKRDCGPLDDGCGQTLDCGRCDGNDSCGGGGTPGLCGCTPRSCVAQGLNCGAVDDGCGASVSCGECSPPNVCGGGGKANVCGCKPWKSCAEAGKSCGTLSDGCGGAALDCDEESGGCKNSETCGGGGANICGPGSCNPTTCVAQGKNCGTISDGCSDTLSCGTCKLPATCGGGGVPNVCACKPKTCDELGLSCGVTDDGCGGKRDCGSCTWPQSCGGGSKPGSCGCTPVSCDKTVECGRIPDGCGGVSKCETKVCARPKHCGLNNTCQLVKCDKRSCAEGQCGIISDGCGDVLTCDECKNGSTCVNNVCQ